MELTRVSEDELARQANILSRLRDKRAKDRQVHVWQVGPLLYWPSAGR